MRLTALTLNDSALGAGLKRTAPNTARRGPLIYVTGRVFNPLAIKAYSSYIEYTKPDNLFFVNSEIYGLLLLILHLPRQSIMSYALLLHRTPRFGQVL